MAVYHSPQPFDAEGLTVCSKLLVQPGKNDKLYVDKFGFSANVPVEVECLGS